MISNNTESTLEKLLIQYRRYFHANPELGWTEYSTVAFICRELNKLGFTLKRGKEFMNMSNAMGLPSDVINAEAFNKALKIISKEELSFYENNNTSLIATYDGGFDKTIAFRFDMDALPIKESSCFMHIPFKEKFISNNEGIMHACGHDFHMSIGLGLAHIISVNKEKLKVNIKLIFQPAEEGVRGAKVLIDSRVLDDVDYIIASHVWSNMPMGKIVCSQDGTSSTHKFNVVFRGKSAHAGICPEEGNNAVLAAAIATVKLHSLIDEFCEIVRVNVGVIEGGLSRNIIADYAKIQVEIRSQNKQVEEVLYNRAVEVVRQASMSQNCGFEISKEGESIGAKGDLSLAKIIKDCAINNKFFNDIVIKDTKNRGCEDFTSMMNTVQARGGKACFIGIGASLNNKNLNHHSPSFDADESVMVHVVDLLYNIIQKHSR